MTVSAAVPMVPDSGMLAPDFTLPAMLGATKSNVDLRALRGRVIVIAFYPGDKTTGCTAELGKFRDEFSQLFGEGVSVLPISADNMTSHAAWSDEMHFPFALLSDTSQTVASLYGSTIPGRAYDNRTVFVVGRDGRILYRNLKFGALSEMAYRDLAAAVARAKAS
ncbi:MAG: redoxin domain-containing protein [bacterium]